MRIRKAILALFILGVLVAVIHIVQSMTLDRIIHYTEVSFISPRWPDELDGYRIAFISDVHTMTDEALQGVVDELNVRNIDILLLGGDFSRHDGRYRRHIGILSQVQTTDGIFGVEGNHDIAENFFAAMVYYGMIPLSNSGLHIHEGFFLAGVEDLWNRNPCIATATADASEDDFVLLVSHNPDVSMQQDTIGIDLIVSGHTHGGQIRFFGLWAPYFTVRSSITDYGQRFAMGWAQSRDGTPVYVSRGTGNYYGYPRVFARPQVILFTMESLEEN